MNLPAQGLVDRFAQGHALDLENLVVVPSGPIPPNPSELLEGGRFDDAARAFLDRGYDHVLFDSPPTLSVSDAVILGHRVDAAVVVVRAHRTPRESIRAAVDKFRQSGVTPIGIVLNDLDAASQGYRHHRYYGRYESVESDRADAV